MAIRMPPKNPVHILPEPLVLSVWLTMVLVYSPPHNCIAWRRVCKLCCDAPWHLSSSYEAPLRKDTSSLKSRHTYLCFCSDPQYPLHDTEWISQDVTIIAHCNEMNELWMQWWLSRRQVLIRQVGKVNWCYSIRYFQVGGHSSMSRSLGNAQFQH